MAGRYINITRESIAAMERWEAFVDKWYRNPKARLNGALCKAGSVVVFRFHQLGDACVAKTAAFRSHIKQVAQQSADA